MDMKIRIQEHKKVVGIVGFIFIVIMECCIFPVCNMTRSVQTTISIVNIFSAFALCKCIGDALKEIIFISTHDKSIHGLGNSMCLKQWFENHPDDKKLL